MELRFRDSGLQKIFEDQRRLQAKYGVLSKKIKLRMSQLGSILTLGVFERNPALTKMTGFHRLGGSMRGELAVSLSPNWRLIFCPCDLTLPFEEVAEIYILSVKDYH